MGFGESGLKWLENELLFEEKYRCFDQGLLSLWIWRLSQYVSRPRILELNLVILRHCCQYLSMDAETMVGSLISLVLTSPFCSPSLFSWPQLSCNHLLLLQVSNLEQIRGISGGNNGRDMRRTEHMTDLLERELLLSGKQGKSKSKTTCERVNSWRCFVEFLTIRANKKICQVLIYFSIVDFYLRRLAIFDRHCSDFLFCMTQTFFRQQK